MHDSQHVCTSHFSVDTGACASGARWNMRLICWSSMSVLKIMRRRRLRAFKCWTDNFTADWVAGGDTLCYNAVHQTALRSANALWVMSVYYTNLRANETDS